MLSKFPFLTTNPTGMEPALHRAITANDEEVVSVLLADPTIEGHVNHTGYRPEQIGIRAELMARIQSGLETAGRRKRTMAWIQKQLPSVQEEA